MIPAPIIGTARLALRPWREADKPAFAAIMNTPAVMRHLGGVTTREVLDALLDAQMAQQEAHGLSMWAAELRGSGELLGICGLRYGGHPGTPVPDELEIGWRFAESAWGRGYAPRGGGGGDRLGLGPHDPPADRGLDGAGQPGVVGSHAPPRHAPPAGARLRSSTPDRRPGPAPGHLRDRPPSGLSR